MFAYGKLTSTVLSSILLYIYTGVVVMVEVNAHITMSVDYLTNLFIIFILLFLPFFTNLPLVGSK